jgi:hypothetical protein
MAHEGPKQIGDKLQAVRRGSLNSVFVGSCARLQNCEKRLLASSGVSAASARMEELDFH